MAARWTRQGTRAERSSAPGGRAASLPQSIVDAVASARLDAEPSAEARGHAGAERESFGAVKAGEVRQADGGEGERLWPTQRLRADERARLRLHALDVGV